MLLRIAPKSKWLSKWVAGVVFILQLIDFVVGKLGYLGIFTSPEDFRTMMERGPVWLQAIWSKISPATFVIANSLKAAWDFLVSPLGTMLAFAFIVLILAVDMDRIARMTRGIWFKVRHAVSEQVWISQQAAISLLMESRWGRLNAPFTEENMLNSIVMPLRSRTGLSPVEKSRIKFRIFLECTLKEFASANPKGYRVSVGPPERSEYDEVMLRAYAEAALNDMIASEFGSAPRITLPGS